MLQIKPGEISTQAFHAYMLSSIAPRPICFASTVDKAGNINLSPFSFFNAFGSNPPIVVFSPARRVRDNTIKHTLENVIETKEVCINVVTYDMVYQASLASTEYPKGVNEFIKSGFTPEPSVLIKAPRVKESPVQMECIVRDVIETGDQGGAANLVIAEIKLMHVSEAILGADRMIDQRKIELVARMGKDWYCKAFGDALFEVEKPKARGVGFDNIPEEIKLSTVLTGNQLAVLGNVDEKPDAETVRKFWAENSGLSEVFGTVERHRKAAEFIEKGMAMEAWCVLLSENK